MEIIELHSLLKEAGFIQDIVDKFDENDIDLEVFLTMGESDFKEIGVGSFGQRRRLKLLVDKCKSAKGTGPETGEKDDQEGSCCLQTVHVDASAVEDKKSPQVSKIRPCITLRKAMESHSEGKVVAQDLDQGKTLSTKQRRTLVKIAVSYLLEKCGSLWPTGVEKEELAKEIVTTWPKTKCDHPGMNGHEHFYHNHDGFLEYRIKNVRATQDQRRRKRKAEENDVPSAMEVEDVPLNQEEEEVAQEKINWMKNSPPNRDNSARIIQYFKETTRYRRALLEKKELTITDMVKEIPRLQDMPELINIDFLYDHPKEADQFLKKWECNFREKIITLGKEEYPAVQDVITDFAENDSRDLCGLLVLLYILHKPLGKGKGTSSREDAVTHFLQTVPTGTNVEVVAQKKDQHHRQPYLLAVGPRRKPHQYFLILDRVLVPAGDTIVQAVDRLFKSHFTFNVEYAPILKNFWEFIASVVYGVLPITSTKASVQALSVSLSCLQSET